MILGNFSVSQTCVFQPRRVESDTNLMVFCQIKRGVDVCYEGLIDFNFSTLKATFPPAWDLRRQEKRAKTIFPSFSFAKKPKEKNSQPSIFVINFSAQPKTVYLINLNLSEINWVLLLSFTLCSGEKTGKDFFFPGEGISSFTFLRKTSLEAFNN